MADSATTARAGGGSPLAEGEGARPPGAAIRARGLDVFYGDFQALHGVDLDVAEGRITSLIGPSGCGKSTLLRACNRILDRLGYVRVQGRLEVLGHDVYAPGVSLPRLRQQVGMVFQRPNPLPLSIRDNILFGLGLHHEGPALPRARRDEVVEEALRSVLLWDEVKDRLDAPAVSLSLEQQQKLCIARLLPVKPRVLLMDEPCSALDAAGTEAVEELIWSLAGRYTILLVTHNMAQARRASEDCVFMLMGRIVEAGPTGEMFVTPRDPRTADYIEGRYG